jgi:hypothetical protein
MPANVSNKAENNLFKFDLKMKKFRSIYLIVVSTFLMYNCEKPNDIKSEKYFTDLHDTLIEASKYWPIYAEQYFSLDIDKDSTIDFSITVAAHFSHMDGPFAENYTQIFPKNGFEIAYTNNNYTYWYLNPDTTYVYNSVLIPKTYNLGDEIKIDDNYTNTPLMITYSFDGGYAVNSGRHYGISSGFKYISFRKIIGNINTLGWIKLKVVYSSSIILNSCRYIENENAFVIE